jgi:2-dehydro-3-deoxy-D-arabinonate dehydratase
MSNQPVRLCRFIVAPQTDVRVGLLEGGVVLDLTAAGVRRLDELFDRPDLAEHLDQARQSASSGWPVDQVRLLTPVESQEIWAAGVTYLRSKQARMEESDFSARAYDHVYEAARPEIFFKAVPEKVVSPGEPVGIRRDARWNVPEPELTLVINSSGSLVGFTIGNDMSSRDIEGENLLYLPQAKIYAHSCAIGPCVVVGAGEADARQWTIRLQIQRGDEVVFAGETRIDQIKRRFGELIEYLFRSQTFPRGAMLLTGAGIVPPDAFTLASGDRIRITISGIGTLENPVTVV